MSDNVVPLFAPTSGRMERFAALAERHESNGERVRFAFRFLGVLEALVDDEMWDRALDMQVEIDKREGRS